MVFLFYNNSGVFYGSFIGIQQLNFCLSLTVKLNPGFYTGIGIILIHFKIFQSVFGSVHNRFLLFETIISAKSTLINPKNSKKGLIFKTNAEIIFIREEAAMIFSQKDLNFSILDVMAFESGNVVCHNKKRSYCALSLRIKSDAQIIHKGKVTNLSDGAVTYFPAETDYIRKSKYDKLIAVHLNVQNYISYEIQSVKPENSDEIYSIFNDMLTVWTQKKNRV